MHWQAKKKVMENKCQKLSPPLNIHAEYRFIYLAIISILQGQRRLSDNIFLGSLRCNARHALNLAGLFSSPFWSQAYFANTF